LDRIDLNLAFLHTVPRTYCDVGTGPDSHTASDFSATYSLAKSFSERHEESLRPMVERGQFAKRCDTVKCRETGEPASMLWCVNKGAKPEPLEARSGLKAVESTLFRRFCGYDPSTDACFQLNAGAL
jgi:hypothetical protein